VQILTKIPNKHTAMNGNLKNGYANGSIVANMELKA
jgi:hypothetical protein